MTNIKYPISNKKGFDIHDRIFDFIVAVINFLNKLLRTQTNMVFINQITRSVTSMGANDQEADGASSKKDFIHGFTVVRKEGKETGFWLRLIKETNLEKFKKEAENLIKEDEEIVAIVSTIIKNSKASGGLN